GSPPLSAFSLAEVGDPEADRGYPKERNSPLESPEERNIPGRDETYKDSFFSSMEEFGRGSALPA
ncbi:MAG: hypothetical protein ACP5K1_03005, partial [Candidatus Bathyarchaeia archaeon]